MSVDASIREFLRERALARADKETIGTDEPLLDSGVLDSASILELVSFLEDRYGISIEDEELVPEHFETIDTVVKLVESKLAARDGGSGTT